MALGLPTYASPQSGPSGASRAAAFQFYGRGGGSGNSAPLGIGGPGSTPVGAWSGGYTTGYGSPSTGPGTTTTTPYSPTQYQPHYTPPPSTTPATPAQPIKPLEPGVHNYGGGDVIVHADDPNVIGNTQQGGGKPMTQQDQIAQWLQAQLGISNGIFDKQNANLLGQAGIANAYQQYVAGNAGQQYGISQGRNDLDQWRAGGTWDILRDELGGQRKTADATWGELQRDVGQQRGFAGRDKAIKDWLNGQNVGFNLEGLAGRMDSAKFDQQRQSRHALQDATGQGAVTSAGHRLDQRDINVQAHQTADAARLDYRKTDAGLQADKRNTQLGYDTTMENLLHQVNTGRISYNDALNSINAGLRSGQLAFDYAGKLHEINGQQNALNRDSAVTGSQLDQQKTIAQLYQQYLSGSGANSSAMTSLMQQLYAFGS